jgi:hypothetical protein
LTRTSSRHVAAAILLVVLVILGAVFLNVIGIDALEGRSEFQFFADSSTYHEAARGELDQVDGVEGVIGISGNFLGPLLVLALAGDNYYVVLMLNALIMFLAVRSISDSLNLDSLKLLAVLLANPLTISSLLSVNKEIIAIAFIALMVNGLVTRSVLALMAALAVSFLVRWQLTAYLVVVLAMANRWNPMRNHRLGSLLVLLIAISVAYVQLAEVFEAVRLNFETAAEDYEGSGTFQWLVKLQEQGWYWLVFPFKAAHLLFATGLRFDRLADPTVIYNDTWVLLHSTATLALFLILWWSRRVTIANDVVYVSLVYLAVFALTPIYASRYFYPVYVFWSMALVAGTGRPKLLSRGESRIGQSARQTPNVPFKRSKSGRVGP